ncbi:MAG: hypothetical protein AAGI71_19680 [Bacteroidota bacterium]
MARPDKQAVLLIHGIGEQRPMDTLRGFVRAVWTTDASLRYRNVGAGVYSKPDEVSGSYELRRLTTARSRASVRYPDGLRTDFYEFYWAHLMQGTTLGHVWNWMKQLLFRRPQDVPPALRGAWFLLIGLLLGAVYVAAQPMLPAFLQVLALPVWMTSVGGLLLSSLVVPILTSIAGDAARYLDASPANIGRRQAIRAKGVEILNKLHACGEYERIIVVGHSLGSVIGYDLLTYAWPDYAGQGDKQRPQPVLDELEDDVVAGALTRDAYQAQQRDLLDELQDDGVPWLVTDFVTLGSPLAHAAVLLAADEADLCQKQEERELPTCPPTLEPVGGVSRFSYTPRDAPHRQLHHAAVFGPTRWTNLYFPAKVLVVGDLIGGPLAPVFGSGIRDLKVRTSLLGGLLSHTRYWTLESDAEPGAHVEALRAALRLLDAEQGEGREGGTSA